MNDFLDGFQLPPECKILSQRILLNDGVKVVEVFVEGIHPELRPLGLVHLENNGWSGGPETRVKITLGLPPEAYLG